MQQCGILSRPSAIFGPLPPLPPLHMGDLGAVGSNWVEELPHRQPLFRLFLSLKKLQLDADAITCSALISACGKGGLWEDALAILESWLSQVSVLHLASDFPTCLKGEDFHCVPEGAWECGPIQGSML